MVIDNLISTQGEQMACALFQRLLGPDGFFTKRNRTVILATNSGKLECDGGDHCLSSEQQLRFGASSPFYDGVQADFH